ncbi:MAG: hypothetical protein HXX12_13760 [Geothrix sp.]|nr:hypothetical protein [Geothrix sp.]NWJ42024.1 hypothetical protein [Geothrix sp.]WIL20008.1 MAG: hypothetical protein QOZ81_002548 [Geothrix sp.]
MDPRQKARIALHEGGAEATGTEEGVLAETGMTSLHPGSRVPGLGTTDR